MAHVKDACAFLGDGEGGGGLNTSSGYVVLVDRGGGFGGGGAGAGRGLCEAYYVLMSGRPAPSWVMVRRTGGAGGRAPRGGGGKIGVEGDKPQIRAQ